MHIKSIPGVLLILFLLISSDCFAGKGDLFLQGRKAVSQGRFQEAIPLLRRYLEAAPKGKHASRALFFIGKADIGLGEYDSAQAVFASLIRDWPATLEARKAQYKLAMLDIWLGNVNNARKRLAAMTSHPDSPLVPEAAAMLRYLEK
ncbi:Tetratricopeptide repeat-containing protein [Candidatus Electrothrix aarhusensis]|jgi:TolA-binding protein|uniref:Tetratricopeptide repeat-containing protein n=1 Tax=Candidatus Electrothrix aarhusensis TaxID=1859131 RepID=A0A444IUJ0_9BACT|nr:Tetratricopeptide repeat-containing protein [Candidatus Electrothrix aarhusensis]